MFSFKNIRNHGSIASNSNNGNKDSFLTNSNNILKSRFVRCSVHHHYYPSSPANGPAQTSDSQSNPVRPATTTTLPITSIDNSTGANLLEYEPESSRRISIADHIDEEDIPSRRSESRATRAQSLFSESRSCATSANALGQHPYPKLHIKNVKSYLPEPERMDPRIVDYMCSRHLSRKRVVPIWNPDRTTRRASTRRVREIAVGDVGHFNGNGGFDVAFNVFLDEDTNNECGFRTPQGFKKFAFQLSENFRVRNTSKQCRVSDDCSEDYPPLDSDNQLAVVSSGVADEGEVLTTPAGFLWEAEESDSTLLKIMPTKKVASPCLVFLPDGAAIHSFSQDVDTDLDEYLSDQGDSWCLHFEERGFRTPSVFVTGVWLAKRFASAVYNQASASGKSLPPSASVVLSATPSSLTSDKISWRSMPGFKTAIAPMKDGFDEAGKLRSKVDDQCFGIEGFVIKREATPAVTRMFTFGKSRQSFSTFRKT